MADSWQRPLGRTGRAVTAIGLGLAALGRPGYLTLGRTSDLGADRSVEAMTARSLALLDAAAELDVRYLDAARSYGRAEEMLGRWLHTREVPADAVTVGSKWGYTYVADWQVDADVHERKDHSLATLRRQLPEMRSHLDPWLDVVQIHSATLDTGVLDDDAVLGALADVRDRGVAVGLSTSGPRQAEVVRRAIAVERGGRALFATVQSTWNVLEPSAGAALAEAHDAGLGVIVKEAVANGRLTPSATPEPGLLAGVRGLVTDDGASLDQVAIAAAVAQPWADVVLSGAVTVDQLRSNVAGAALAAHLDGDRLASLCEAAEPAERYWATRSALPWT